MAQSELDEKTLALLFAVSEITGKSQSLTSLRLIYERATERAANALKEGGQDYIYEGFI